MTTNLDTNPYYTPKPEGDIDLIEVIRGLLIESGLAANMMDSFDNHPLVVNSQNKISNVQRFNMNRYWSIQLMSVNTCSEQERFCLIPNGDINEWITLFKDKILPFLVEHDLPKTI